MFSSSVIIWSEGLWQLHAVRLWNAFCWNTLFTVRALLWPQLSCRIMKPCIENNNKSVCFSFPSTKYICLIDYSLPSMRVIVYWEHISLSASSTLSESVITMGQISAGSPSLSRLRRPWKRISGVGCQPIGPELFIPLKPIHTLHV